MSDRTATPRRTPGDEPARRSLTERLQDTLSSAAEEHRAHASPSASRGRRAALEEAERWCVGLRTHDRIGAAAYQQRMSGLARGQRTLPRGGRDG